MDPATFLTELKRRKVYRVAVAYAIAVDYADESVTLLDLRQRWEWDPLRKDPRFQKILAGPEPKTLYN